MKKITSARIFREGMKELKRSAFSTPSISRRNSLDIPSSSSRRNSQEGENNKNDLTISSLVKIESLSIM